MPAALRGADFQQYSSCFPCSLRSQSRERTKIRPVAVTRFWIFLLLTSCFAQAPVFPLRDVHPGLRGTGRTIFSGDKLGEFQVELLCDLDNLGPNQSIILARL